MSFHAKLASIFVLLAGLAVPATCQTTTASLVHEFTGPDGALSFSSLAAGGGGALYGTTYVDGPKGFGTVYQLTPPASPGSPWTETTLYSFAGLASGDGGYVFAGVVSDPAGNLYGATHNGGSDQFGCPLTGYGCGTVYELSPPGTPGGSWSETLLHVFQASTDGSTPSASLIRDGNGNLYGTASGGGPNGFGTVFRLSKPASSSGPWTYAVLYAFTGAGDGGQPFGSLVFDSTGALYGTTLAGGTYFAGTAFRLAPPSSPGGTWSESVMHSFGGANDGSMPYARLVFDSQGQLYGTTDRGSGSAANGIVFRLTPGANPAEPWTEHIIHSFGSGQAAGLAGGVTFDPSGNLWGTSAAGGSGCSLGCGSVFELAPPTEGVIWPLHKIYYFNYSYSGANPNSAPFITPDGTVYVTTTGGGPNLGVGTVVSTKGQ